MCQGGGGAVGTPRSCGTLGSDRRRAHHVVENSKGNLQDSYLLSQTRIGRGGFGAVFAGTRRSTCTVRAVKSVAHGGRVERKILGSRTHEADVMAIVDHPNVVRLLETFQDKTHVHLVMEMCAGGNLQHRLDQAQRFPAEQVARAMRQVLHAVCHLHNLGICHRDLKLENMLLQWPSPLERNVVKVADFGLSCVVAPGEVLSAKLGTLRYWSPEVLHGRYGQPCDVWSCGVASFALLCGRLPFDSKRDDDVAAKIKRGNYAFAGSAWEAASAEVAKTFVRGLLRFDAGERLTAGSALEVIHDSFSTRNELSAATAELPQCKVDAVHAGIMTLGRSPPVRRAALRALAWQSDEAESQGVYSLFLALDFDGDGLLSAEELMALRSWPNSSAVEQFARKICPLDYTDFLVMMHGESLCLRTNAYRPAFEALDRDGDGKISAGDLQGLPGFAAGAPAPELTFQDFTDEVRTLHL